MYKKLKKLAIPVLVVVSLLFVITSASADPVGDLPPLSEVSKQMLERQEKSLQDMKDAIPSRERVGIPIFPGSLFCSEMSMEGMLPTVIMASNKPVAEVSEWYMQQDGLNWSEQWSMFYVGDRYVMMKSEAVLLQDISDDPQASACGMAFEMIGMKTQFSISYKPKTSDS